MADTAIGTGLDIMNRYKQATAGTKDGEFDPSINRTEAQEKYDKMYKDKTTLDFTDMLSLMVAQFQNQTIDNQADTSDMMNQLTQMTSMQAMNDMVAQMNELTTANILSYSASLVGKTVTVGVYNEKGELKEIVGEVEGAGTYDGQQVIFIGGKSYLLSSIMAVGTLPPPKDPEKPDGTDPEKPDGTDPENPDGEDTNTDNSTNTDNNTDTNTDNETDDGAVG